VEWTVNAKKAKTPKPEPKDFLIALAYDSDRFRENVASTDVFQLGARSANLR
jgi:hypothetical protein